MLRFIYLFLLVSLFGTSLLTHASTDDTLRLLAQTADRSPTTSTTTAIETARPVQTPVQVVTTTTVETSNVFGAQLFTGQFALRRSTGFNPNYVVGIGDIVTIRMWGAYEFEKQLTVDARGHIFVPGVGPIYVQGVNNQNLNEIVEAQVRKVYRSNVGVYASLETTQPVKVFVTGFVRRPGLYDGVSSDSPLSYIDLAGGIDPARGSYLQVNVMRNGMIRKSYNLYDFLLSGEMEQIQFADGDTIMVLPRKHSVLVTGQVFNPYSFEFEEPEVPLERILSMAKPKPNATHVSILRRTGTMTTNEYHYIPSAQGIMIQDGDEVNIMADKFPGTIIVRVAGAHSGEHALVLPYGATLEDALKRIIVNPRSDLDSIQLYRKSVAIRQKEMLNLSLQALEAQTLTATSATSEEAALRKIESDQVARFVERARSIEPQGRVVLGGPDIYRNTLLEDGDTITIPEKTSLVMVHGEVLFPTAILHRPNARVGDYIQLAGGYTQNADKARIIIARADGSAEGATPDAYLNPGDEVMVLMKIDTKNIEVARGISTILYQIALSAKVLLGL